MSCVELSYQTSNTLERVKWEVPLYIVDSQAGGWTLPEIGVYEAERFLTPVSIGLKSLVFQKTNIPKSIPALSISSESRSEVPCCVSDLSVT